MSDDANDVSKALAAFGSPSIRYHSFGQSSVKASVLAPPRRPAVTTLPPTVSGTEALVAQPEPVAAPEPTLETRIVPAPIVVARPSPVLREPPALRPAPLFPPTPTVAPPPRPLAEWAAPIVSTPTRPQVVAPVPAIPPVPVAPAELPGAAPASFDEPRPTPTLMPDIPPAPVAMTYPAVGATSAPRRACPPGACDG